MGNIIDSQKQQADSIDLTDNNLSVKNQFNASGPSTFYKEVTFNDLSTFNKPVKFVSDMTVNGKINDINLDDLQNAVNSMTGPTGKINTSSIKTSNLDINGDISNSGTGDVYITANTGIGLQLKDGKTGGAYIKLYNGIVTVNGSITAGAISGNSLDLKSGTIASGDITSSGVITGTSLDLKTGSIASGDIKAGAITSSGVITGNSLDLKTGTISSGAITSSGVISGTSLDLTTGTIKSGAITSTGDIIGGTLSLGREGLKIGTQSWRIKENSSGSLCFYKDTQGLACINSAGNLVTFTA